MRDRALPRGIAVVALAAALALAASVAAGADALKPAVKLGPVTVANGVATLNGSLGGNPSTVTLTVNGKPVALNAAGQFSATIDLGGTSALQVGVTNPTTGDVVTTTIPLSLVGADGVVPAGILDSLQQAAISVAKPLDGFATIDGKPLEVSGAVLDKGQLSKLEVNGTDVLAALKPDGTFSQMIPGSDERVTVTATDKEGVTQSSSYAVRDSSTVIATSAGPSVAAQGADGLRVAAVRYVTKNVRAKKRLTMTVTVRDRQGRLVRDATVRVRVANFQVRRHFVRGGQQAKFTSKVGTAGFTIAVTKAALGKRVFMFSLAKTPSATAKRTTSVRLPRAKRRAH